MYLFWRLFTSQLEIVENKVQRTFKKKSKTKITDLK